MKGLGGLVGLVLSIGMLLLSGCASLEPIDMSDVNSPLMNLRQATGVEAASLLRNLSSTGGGVGCTVCAH